MTLLPRQRKILCCHNFALAQPQSPSILRYPSPIPTVKRAQTHTMNLQPIKHLLRALLALFVFIVKLAEAGTVTVTIGEDAVNNRVFAGWVGSLSGFRPLLSILSHTVVSGLILMIRGYGRRMALPPVSKILISWLCMPCNVFMADYNQWLLTFSRLYRRHY